MGNTNKIEDAAPRSQFDGRTPGSLNWTVDGVNPAVEGYRGGGACVVRLNVLGLNGYTERDTFARSVCAVLNAAPDLLAQRDELAAALRTLDDVLNEPNGHENGWDAALIAASDRARAALAKVTR